MFAAVVLQATFTLVVDLLRGEDPQQYLSTLDAVPTQRLVRAHAKRLMRDFLESPQAISLADFLDKLQEIQGVLMDEYSVDDFSKLMAVREPFMEFMKKTAERKFLQSFYIVEEGATNKRFIADVDRTDDALVSACTTSRTPARRWASTTALRAMA